MALAKRQTAWLFLALSAMVYAAVFFVSRAPAASIHPRGIGLGAACDLMITVPVLYYLLLIRPGYSSWTMLATVFLAGARAVGFVLPAAMRSGMPPLRWLGVPLELGIVVTLLRRGGTRGVAGALLATEVQVFYYGLLAWRARPESEPDSRSFSLAEASGYGMFSLLLMMAIVVEILPLHLLLQQWSHAAAWIGTALGVYSFIWMLALRRSLALHPVLVGPETVRLQIGFLRRVEFRRHQIRGVRRISAADVPGAALVVFNDPQWLIEFREPVAVRGLFGRRKMVTSIGAAVDDGAGFGAALMAPTHD